MQATHAGDTGDFASFIRLPTFRARRDPTRPYMSRTACGEISMQKTSSRSSNYARRKEKVGKASFSRRLFHHYPAGSHPYYMDVDDDDDMQRALAMSMEAARLPQGTAPAADDADGDDSMSKALAMSMDPEPVATADDDDDMAKALAMSMEPTPAPAPSKHDLLEREGFSARLKELFEEAKVKGQEPNAAAASALAQAQNEQKVQLDQRAAAAASSKHDLLSREGFSTRVKELFEAAKAKGQDANAAAATALAQAQKEQLAAAAQARSARGGGPTSPPRSDRSAAGGGAPAPAGVAAAGPPPLATQPSESAEQTFERWEEVEKVAQAQVDAINALYKEEGVTFVDPSFPPTNRALYLSDETATTWQCKACSKRNQLPPRPDEQQLLRLMTDPNAAGRLIKCSFCSHETSMLECALRPAGWGRPHELRDDVTFQFSTVPWVLVRAEPRPDDIRQGHVGNCWFVCALSALAEDRANIDRILLTKDLNHAGVYQVRDCTGVLLMTSDCVTNWCAGV